MCVAPWTFPGGNMARVTVVLLHERKRWLRILPWLHVVVTRDHFRRRESLDMANAFGSLDRKATENAIQPRLRDIDKFFFLTRRQLF